MAAPILVTGGTGTLGSRLVPKLRDAGADVRVLSRRSEPGLATGDLDTGEGVAAAVDGVQTVVHCAGSNKGNDTQTLTLVRAAAAAGVRHLVFISVVGADRIPVTSALDKAMFGYFASKRAAEQVVTDSGLGWTTLRATQFHDLLLTVAQKMEKLPVIPVPRGFRFQPVDTDEVATRLAELALGSPSGLVPDVGGPRVHTVEELVDSYLVARHRRRRLAPVPLAGRAARAVREGATLAPGHAVGGRTWEEFLAERVR